MATAFYTRNPKFTYLNWKRIISTYLCISYHRTNQGGKYSSIPVNLQKTKESVQLGRYMIWKPQFFKLNFIHTKHTYWVQFSLWQNSASISKAQHLPTWMHGFRKGLQDAQEKLFACLWSTWLQSFCTGPCSGSARQYQRPAVQILHTLARAHTNTDCMH